MGEYLHCVSAEAWHMLVQCEDICLSVRIYAFEPQIWQVSVFCRDILSLDQALATDIQLSLRLQAPAKAIVFQLGF